MSRRLPRFEGPFLIVPPDARATTAGPAAQLRESVHVADSDEDKLDLHLKHVAKSLQDQTHASIQDLYHQYQHEAGTVIDRVVPYEERPPPARRADLLYRTTSSVAEKEGDGLVLVVHAQIESSKSVLTKLAVCSGFVIDASLSNQQQGDTIVTCAHTLEQMYGHFRRNSTSDSKTTSTISFILPSSGQPRAITSLLSSMPRSDAIILEAQPAATSRRLRPLPLTPFPVYTGTPVLTHLFGCPDPPIVQRSIARTKAKQQRDVTEKVETPINWLGGHAWRRWGSGVMLGYRSYTGLELEVGVWSQPFCLHANDSRLEFQVSYLIL